MLLLHKKTSNLASVSYCVSCVNITYVELMNELKIKWKRPFTEHRGKPKFCAHCGNVATQEALFDVEGASLTEKNKKKYCDICIKKINV